MAEGVKFLVLLNLHVGLSHRGHSDFFALGLDELGLPHELLRQFPNRAGHGGGIELGLALPGHLQKDGLDVLNKTHVEHFVGLVQNHGGHFSQVNGAAADVVQKAARGPHNNLGRFF